MEEKYVIPLQGYENPLCSTATCGTLVYCTTSHVRVEFVASFRNIIQHAQPDALLERLHQLIDGRGGADVGSVLLHCKQNGFISRMPTQQEFCSEFVHSGSWKSIQKYMNENNEYALIRANGVVI